jgi:sugar-specific transcriptional regulator TrmB/DNA-binding CsgD family transcriptional regulator
MLQPLGISAEAEAVYVALGPLSSASVDDLAKLTGATPDEVRDTLEELRRLGLATESSTSWRPLPLLDVINQLKVQRLSEIEMASVAAEALNSNLLAAGETRNDEIKILVGRESIVAAHRELLDSAKRELCFFDKAPYVQVRPGVTEEDLRDAPEWRALDRGVNLRVVYHPGFDPDRLTELGLFARKGERARTAPVPMKLILVDSHTALIPSMRSYNPGHELRASIVRHALLVEALQWLFEAVWDASVPIMASFSADHDPRRQMLVSLLMTGSTDSAIANTLNINVRSVRRWISELMDELGVTTRLQLGAALVRSDGLKEEP